jgi:hypothetical protein
MISHALTIVVNELNSHFDDVYGLNSQDHHKVGIRNLADELGASNVGVNSASREAINFSVVNIKEEKSLKNIAHVTRDDISMKALYENPPVFLNFQILVTATHASYSDALLMLSRVIRYFQYKHVFTQDDVKPTSITKNAPTNALDQLNTFKLIFDLYSLTMEEANHMWGTLGGKQFPFVLYTMRMLDLKFVSAPKEGELISEVVTDIYHKPAVGM